MSPHITVLQYRTHGLWVRFGQEEVCHLFRCNIVVKRIMKYERHAARITLLTEKKSPFSNRSTTSHSTSKFFENVGDAAPHCLAGNYQRLGRICRLPLSARRKSRAWKSVVRVLEEGERDGAGLMGPLPPNIRTPKFHALLTLLP